MNTNLRKKEKIYDEAFEKSMDVSKDMLKLNKASSVRENMDILCEALEEEILKSDADREEKQSMLARLRKLCSTETNIMLVGATGCGKSSTINALFSCNQQEEYVEVAKVGSRTDPETKDIRMRGWTRRSLMRPSGFSAGSAAISV